MTAMPSWWRGLSRNLGTLFGTYRNWRRSGNGDEQQLAYAAIPVLTVMRQACDDAIKELSKKLSPPS